MKSRKKLFPLISILLGMSPILHAAPEPQSALALSPDLSRKEVELHALFQGSSRILVLADLGQTTPRGERKFTARLDGTYRPSREAMEELNQDHRCSIATDRTMLDIDKSTDLVDEGFKEIPPGLRNQLDLALQGVLGQAGERNLRYFGKTYATCRKTVLSAVLQGYDPGSFLFALDLDAPTLQPMIESGKLAMLGVIDIGKAIKDWTAKNAEARRIAEESVARSSRTESQLKDAPTSYVAVVIRRLPDPGNEGDRLPVAMPPRACAIRATSRAEAESTMGYAYSEPFSSAIGRKRDYRFDELADDLEGLFQMMQGRRCAGAILTGQQAGQLTGALRRINIDFELLELRSAEELLPLYASARGYRNVAQLQLAGAMGGSVTPGQVSTLNEAGILTKGDADAVARRMASTGYSGDTSPESIIRFLNDEKEAARTRSTAVAVKKAREDSLAKAAQARVQEQKRVLEARAREYPYEAVLTCGMPGIQTHISILPCLSTGGARGVETELKIGIGSTEKVYKTYNILRAGAEQRDGFHVDLPAKFSLHAQNANPRFVLGLKIVDRVTGKTVLERQAGQFDVVTASN